MSDATLADVKAGLIDPTTWIAKRYIERGEGSFAGTAVPWSLLEEAYMAIERLEAQPEPQKVLAVVDENGAPVPIHIVMMGETLCGAPPVLGASVRGCDACTQVANVLLNTNITVTMKAMRDTVRDVAR